MPDLAHRSARPVPLEGVHGPLSAAQSRAMLGAIAAASCCIRRRRWWTAIELAAWEHRSPALHLQEWFGRLWDYWL
ncbi:hypothetical protein [uncultured Sphaerotilus sp.]|uniref:hypothetical protein n=1 Tax=uncultured Sphaerotilus sp. TaxID=474984 RepID=UPI0030CA506D